MGDGAPLKEVRFIGNSRDDLIGCPDDIRDRFGFALYRAQLGIMPNRAKPLKGFGGARVLEIIAAAREGTFRAVYTVQFEKIIYVLHVFQKKSKSGTRTDRADILKIHSRLKEAEVAYALYLQEIADAG